VSAFTAGRTILGRRGASGHGKWSIPGTMNSAAFATGDGTRWRSAICAEIQQRKLNCRDRFPNIDTTSPASKILRLHGPVPSRTAISSAHVRPGRERRRLVSSWAESGFVALCLPGLQRREFLHDPGSTLRLTVCSNLERVGKTRQRVVCRGAGQDLLLRRRT